MSQRLIEHHRSLREDELYLEDLSAQEQWVGTNLEPLGLVRVDRGAFQVPDGGHERRILFRVTEPEVAVMDPDEVSSFFENNRGGEPDGDLRARISTNTPPHVILISIDTLRADHLGSYGYSRNTSPFLDRFASTGVRFANAISQAIGVRPTRLRPKDRKSARRTAA